MNPKTLTIIIAIVALSIIPHLSSAVTPTQYHWIAQIGTADSDVGAGISIPNDGSKSILICGGSRSLGTPQLGLGDYFVAKYNAAGSMTWYKRLGTAAEDVCESISSTDSGGNIAVVGRTDGAFAGFTNAGSRDIFISKLSSSGTHLWTQQIGSSGNDFGFGVAMDSNDGSIAACGYTHGDLGRTNPNPLSADAVLFKYNSGGSLQWQKQFGATGTDQAKGVLIDKNSNVYVTGYVSGSIDGEAFDPSKIAFAGFLVKYNSAGTRQWTRLLGATGTTPATTAFRSVAVDSSSGSVYLTGFVNADIDGQQYNGGTQDVILAKYSDSGTKQWVRVLGTAEQDYADSVVVDSKDDVWISGRTRGAFTGFTSSGDEDVFVAKYTKEGVLKWVYQLGTTGQDYSSDIAVSTDGNPYIVGTTKGSMDGDSASYKGSYDVFLKTACTTGTWMSSSSSSSTCSDCAAGSFQGDTTLDSTGCSKCGVGTYSGSAGQSSCVDCSPGTYASSIGSPLCSKCPSGYYCQDSKMSTPQACPAGTYGDTLGQTSCASCPFPSRCLGKSLCAKGFAGQLCGGCAPGYHSVNNECISCPVIPVAVLVLAALLIGSFVLFVWFVVPIHAVSRFKIMVNFLQLVTLVMSMNFVWNSQLREVINVFEFFNLDAAALSPKCLVKTANWHTTYALTMAMTSMFFLIVFSIYLYVRWRHKKAQNTVVRNEASERLLERTTSVLTSLRRLGFLIIVITYLPVTTVALKSFRCVASSTGVLFFLYDTGIECHSPQHVAVWVWSGVCLVGLGLGFPLWIGFKIYRVGVGNKTENQNKKPEWLAHRLALNSHKWGSLYESYKWEYSSFEVISLLRKALSAGLLVLTWRHPIEQAAAQVVVALLYLALVLWVSPYVPISMSKMKGTRKQRSGADELNLMESIGAIGVAGVSIAVLLAVIDHETKGNQPSKWNSYIAEIIAILFSLFCFAIMFLILGIRLFNEGWKSLVAQVKVKSSDELRSSTAELLEVSNDLVAKERYPALYSLKYKIDMSHRSPLHAMSLAKRTSNTAKYTPNSDANDIEMQSISAAQSQSQPNYVDSSFPRIPHTIHEFFRSGGSGSTTSLLSVALSQIEKKRERDGDRHVHIGKTKTKNEGEGEDQVEQRKSKLQCKPADIAPKPITMFAEALNDLEAAHKQASQLISDAIVKPPKIISIVEIDGNDVDVDVNRWVTPSEIWQIKGLDLEIEMLSRLKDMQDAAIESELWVIERNAPVFLELEIAIQRQSKANEKIDAIKSVNGLFKSAWKEKIKDYKERHTELKAELDKVFGGDATSNKGKGKGKGDRPKRTIRFASDVKPDSEDAGNRNRFIVTQKVKDFERNVMSRAVDGVKRALRAGDIAFVAQLRSEMESELQIPIFVRSQVQQDVVRIPARLKPRGEEWTDADIDTYTRKLEKYAGRAIETDILQTKTMIEQERESDRDRRAWIECGGVGASENMTRMRRDEYKWIKEKVVSERRERSNSF